MAYIAAANVTVTLAQKDIVPLGMSKKMTFPTIAFGNGALQYTALGIPMPAIAYYGFKRAIERVFIEQPANGFIYHFDRTNRKMRIFLGAARDAITVANHVGVAPTGNVAAANHVGVAPTGNVAVANHVGVAPTGNVAAPTFTGDAFAPGTPAGNVTEAAHSHDLTILANNAGAGTSTDGVGVNAANQALVSETVTGAVIPGGNVANKGGVDSTTPANATFTGVALANVTPTGNVSAPAFTGDAPSNFTHSATFTGDAPSNFTHSATFTGDAPSNFTHTVTGGGAVAEAPLAEMDDGVAPAAVTLYTQMIGQ